jgi:putative ABC transport system permease protein
MLKNPGVTIIAVLALSLGIGLTTTTFSIVYGALYRGLPFEDSQRIMHLERNNLAQDIESMEVTLHDFLDWREQQTTFEEIAGFYVGTVNVSGTEKPDRYEGAFISANAFDILRVQAFRGRAFRPGEDDPGTAPVILLSYRIWQDRFEGNPEVLGQTLRANGEEMTIVGVMPEGFEFPFNEDLWLPLRMDPLRIERGEGITLEVFGRLRDGVTLDQAGVEFASIARRLELEYPETNEGVSSVIKPFTEEYIGEEPATLLFTMFAAVFLVLLIACANVANLLLARTAARTKEVAIRTALGANRLQVILQMIAEAFVLSAIGAVIGLGLGWVGVRLFNNAIASTDPPFWIDIKIDPLAVMFAVGLAVLSAVIAGIVPAIQATGTRVHEVLKDEARGTSSLRLGRLSRALVVTEIALSVGLLVAAGLMIKSVTNLRNIDFGFATDNVFTARVGLFDTDYPDDASRVRFAEELVRRLETMPGAQHASLTSSLPAMGSGRNRFAVEGDAYATDQDYPLTRVLIASPNFFSTFEVNLMEGRDFRWSDHEDALPVAIVNQPFARRFFDGESPVGRRIRLGDSETEEPWRTIVGVVPDMYMGGVDNEDPEGIYVPISQDPLRFMSVAVRATANPMGLAPLVRDEVIKIDRDLPIYWVWTMADAIARNTWFYRVFGVIFIIFGAVALFLASVGLYGVMAFSVSRRTQEVGVRMALGAQAKDVLKLVFRQGLVQLVIGLVIGLALATALSRGLEVVLFRVEPWDPLIFFAIVIVLVLTSIAASVVPARRATRVDPMVALRYE